MLVQLDTTCWALYQYGQRVIHSMVSFQESAPAAAQLQQSDTQLACTAPPIPDRMLHETAER